MRAEYSTRSMRTPARAAAVLVIVLIVLASVPSVSWAQTGGVASTSIRPFVTAIIPVVGRSGLIGGVSIDPNGVVARSDVEVLGKLRDLRTRALARMDSDLAATSSLRKISVRRLVEEIARRRREGKPVSDELQNLAGLQRVQFVIAYPEQHDIVLAGFAEGWTVDPQGNLVGQTTGEPVLQLDDFLVALRTAKSAATGDGITCSIDPTPDGVQRLQRLLATRDLPMNEATVARLEEALGPQKITLTGVPPESRFALVMVAADYMLKRLGMKLEPAPVADLPSYLEMLQARSAAIPRGAMPRFWLAPSYEPLARDAEGLTWELRGPGVQAFAEDGSVSAAGTPITSRSKGSSLAQQWADAMTAKYGALSQSLPVFRELRNCMDWAVVAALFTKEDLPGRTGCDLSVLLDDKRVKTASNHVPKTLDSRASIVPKGRSWIISVSGGVAIDSWSVLNRVEMDPDLQLTHNKATPADPKRWWWD